MRKRAFARQTTREPAAQGGHTDSRKGRFSFFTMWLKIKVLNGT